MLEENVRVQRYLQRGALRFHLNMLLYSWE